MKDVRLCVFFYSSLFQIIHMNWIERKSWVKYKTCGGCWIFVSAINGWNADDADYSLIKS